LSSFGGSSGRGGFASTAPIANWSGASPSTRSEEGSSESGKSRATTT
jgi:hypothetical protein